MNLQEGFRIASPRANMLLPVSLFLFYRSFHQLLHL